MRKIFLFLLSLTIISLQIHAQALKIGDKLPNDVLKNLFGEKRDSSSINIFAGKSIIIDFWATSCGSCVASFPKLNSIQNNNEARLKIISITPQKSDTIESFFLHHPKIKKPNILMVTGDKKLCLLFPHTWLPHVIWIDSIGIIRYITDGSFVSEGNVTKFLLGENINPIVKEDISKIDREHPFIGIDNFKWLDHAERYSSIMHYIEGSNLGEDMVKNSKGILKKVFISTSIMEMLKKSFDNSLNDDYTFSAPKTVKLISKNPDKYFYPKKPDLYDEWASKNQYLYECYIKDPQKDEVFKTMQTDLSSFFHLDVKVVIMPMKCWVIIKTEKVLDHDMIIRNEQNILNDGENIVFNDNTDLLKKLLTTELLYSHQINVPIIDGTGLKRSVTLRIKRPSNGEFKLKDCKEGLKEYGFDLIQEIKPVKVLVVKEL